MISAPISLPPTATLDDAEALMARHKISGVPIVIPTVVLSASSPIAMCGFAPGSVFAARHRFHDRRRSGYRPWARARKRWRCCTSIASRSFRWSTRPVCCRAWSR